VVTAGKRASLREKRESIEFPLSQSRSCGTVMGPHAPGFSARTQHKT
jgi:hypothetical protein